MRKIIVGLLSFVVLGSTALMGTASAAVHQNVKYTYAGDSSTDSSTCGPDWANDTFTRSFTVYQQPATDGSYRVVEAYTKGHFTTLAAPSPESCEAGNTNTVAAGITGTFSGTITIKVSNGTLPTAAPSCPPGSCSTDAWIHAAFGGSATYAEPDYYFYYKTSARTACAKTWTDAATGDGGDIATSC